MNKQEEIKRTGSYIGILEGFHWVNLWEERGDTIGVSSKFFPTKEQALREIHILENYNIYKALAEA